VTTTPPSLQTGHVLISLEVNLGTNTSFILMSNDLYEVSSPLEPFINEASIIFDGRHSQIEPGLWVDRETSVSHRARK
jgi:hypothetical protein